MKKVFFKIIILGLWSCKAFAVDYYVDFDSGNDNNTGTTIEDAWKHAPGDPNAMGRPAEITLVAGDIVIFKGGVIYQGNIALNASGDSVNHITYKGDGWGTEKAIIDGSMQITGWTALNDSIFYADIPSEFTIGETSASLNLHEYNNITQEDEFMWTAQWPNPQEWFFYDDCHGFQVLPNHNIKLGSITDSTVFYQTDTNYWKNSSLLIWLNGNTVDLRKITGYSPELRTVYFDSLNANAIYPDKRDQAYAIYNSIHALDKPGEYYANFEEGRIYIYPRDAKNIEKNLSLSVREYGFNTVVYSGITIEGFVIRKHSGDNLRGGIGIGSFSGSSFDKSFYTIRNNYISHNRHPIRGYGGIFMAHISNSLIENNEIEDNFRHRGIYCSAGKNVIITNNTIRRSGSTSLTLYTMLNSQITYNSVLESKGGHANGITMYMGSKNILVASNKIIDCFSPLTFQDGGNFYLINNLIDSKDNNYGINEWGRTTRGPWEYGEVVLLNNTIISVPNEPALNIERSLGTFVDNEGATIYPCTYFSYNNIIDAGGGNIQTERDYNLYTSLAWNQEERFDWYLADNELIEENRASIFVAPEGEDFRLCENSPAIAVGTDVTPLLPIDKFPNFNFNVDINNFPRPIASSWSIGAYEFGSEDSFVDNINSGVLGNLVICYPNPTKGILYFEIDQYNIQNIRISDLSGKTIVRKTQLQENESIDLSRLKNGVYIISIQTDIETIFKKIVKE